MLPEAKQPPAYKLSTLPAGQSVVWRFTVHIVGFGRVSIQPFIQLTANGPLDSGTDPRTEP